MVYRIRLWHARIRLAVKDKRVMACCGGEGRRGVIARCGPLEGSIQDSAAVEGQSLTPRWVRVVLRVVVGCGRRGSLLITCR